MSDSPFSGKSIPGTYFSFALPVVIGMVITILYNITDTYFIALTRNTDLVAGISLCGPVFTLLMAFGNIYGQGGSSLISRLLGENRQENLRRVSAFCFYAAILTGAFFGAVMLLFRQNLLTLLGADASTRQYAQPYYTWMAAGAPLVVLTFIHTNLLRSEGMAKEAMFANIGGSVVNIVLDPVFIFALGLGAAGAAIATLFGYLFTDLYCLYIVGKKSEVLSVDPTKCRIGREDLSQIFGIGIAAALSNIMSSFCTVFTNQSLLPYGSDKIAAMGIAQRISMIVMLVITGFAFGGSPLIGYFYGKKDTASLKKLLSFAVKFLCTLALVMSAVLIAAALPAVRLFLEDASLVGVSVQMLRAQLAGMVFMAMVLLCQILFQASGKTVPALLLSVSRQGVVFAVVLFAASRAFGLTGIVYTQLTADVLSAAMAVILARSAFRNDGVLGRI